MKERGLLRASPTGLLALLAATGLTLAAPATSQTVFAWPDTAVDVGKYTTVEECLAAVGRVVQAAERLEALTSWSDTLPWDPRASMKPAPKEATKAARRCGAQFTASAVPLAKYQWYLDLFLAAQRDSDAGALVRRRLEAARQESTVVTDGAVIDSIVGAYLRAQPPRLDSAEALLNQRAHRVDRILRTVVYDSMMNMAGTHGDTALARLLAQRLLATVDSLTPADVQSEEFERHYPPPVGLGGPLYDAIVNHLEGRQLLLDSLRRGTAAMATLEHAWWHQYTQQRAGSFPLPIGDTAPPLRGDFWFPNSAAGRLRPEPGHVSYVVFLESSETGAVDDSAAVEGGQEASRFAKLRRLGHRFPALQIIIVGRTRGWFSYALMSSPAEEAEWYREWVQANAPPAGVTIAVDSARSLRLPAPDSRWLSRGDSNATAYSFKLTSSAGFGGSFLVDQQGLVVDAGNSTEAQLTAMIEVLLHRAASQP